MTFYDLPIGNLFTLEENSLFPLVFKKLDDKHYLSADQTHRYHWALGDNPVYETFFNDSKTTPETIFFS